MVVLLCGYFLGVAAPLGVPVAVAVPAAAVVVVPEAAAVVFVPCLGPSDCGPAGTISPMKPTTCPPLMVSVPYCESPEKYQLWALLPVADESPDQSALLWLTEPPKPMK